MANTTDLCHLTAGDPEIAGLGVIIAFLTSICVTVVIILFLYLKEWLPPSQYSKIDKAITCFFSRHTRNANNKDDEGVSNNNDPSRGEAEVSHDAKSEEEDARLSEPVVQDRNNNDPSGGEVEVGHDAESEEVDFAYTFEGYRDRQRVEEDLQRRKNARIAPLLKLLANLTDQQLFFGLSVSLATYIRLSDIDEFSAYSFKISTTSVWLSCLTQMAAITSLRHDLYPEAGRAWRAAAMALQLVLLVPILLLSNLPVFLFDPSLSFRCAWNQIKTYNREQIQNFALLAASAVVTVVTGYGSAILALLGEVGSTKARKDSGKARHGSLAVRLRRCLKIRIRRAKAHLLIRWLLFLIKLFQYLRASFLWRLLWVAFYLTFGITGLIFSWKLISPLEQWSVSFGQLVPLILLIFIFPPVYEERRARLKPDAPPGGLYTESESPHDDFVTRYSGSMGNWVYVFLVGATLALFVWLEFLALLIGGAFFTAMAESSPRSWIGISIFGCSSAVGLPSGIIILDWSLEREQEREQEKTREQENQQELGVV